MCMWRSRRKQQHLEKKERKYEKMESLHLSHLKLMCFFKFLWHTLYIHSPHSQHDNSQTYYMEVVHGSHYTKDAWETILNQINHLKNLTISCIRYWTGVIPKKIILDRLQQNQIKKIPSIHWPLLFILILYMYILLTTKD